VHGESCCSPLMVDVPKVYVTPQVFNYRH
jgi:hypothetical protein